MGLSKTRTAEQVPHAQLIVQFDLKREFFLLTNFEPSKPIGASNVGFYTGLQKRPILVLPLKTTNLCAESENDKPLFSLTYQKSPKKLHKTSGKTGFFKCFGQILGL